jgi:hypothetical protein
VFGRAARSARSTDEQPAPPTPASRRPRSGPGMPQAPRARPPRAPVRGRRRAGTHRRTTAAGLGTAGRRSRRHRQTCAGGGGGGVVRQCRAAGARPRGAGRARDRPVAAAGPRRARHAGRDALRQGAQCGRAPAPASPPPAPRAPHLSTSSSYMTWPRHSSTAAAALAAAAAATRHASAASRSAVPIRRGAPRGPKGLAAAAGGAPRPRSESGACDHAVNCSPKVRRRQRAAVAGWRGGPACRDRGAGGRGCRRAGWSGASAGFEAGWLPARAVRRRAPRAVSPSVRALGPVTAAASRAAPRPPPRPYPCPPDARVLRRPTPVDLHPPLTGGRGMDGGGRRGGPSQSTAP